MTAIRVLLVDDHEPTVLGFSMMLAPQPEFEVLGTARDGLEAVELTARHAPDVVLMDVRMPGLDGISATARITARCPDSRVLILTTFDLDEYALEGLRAGASGFLLKDARPTELLDAIRAVSAGDAVVTPRITRKLLEGARASPGHDDATGGGGGNRRDPGAALAALTSRETEIMAAIAEGMTNAEIAAHFTLAGTTVKTYVGRILHKLGLRDRVQIVILAYETGLAVPGGWS
ncbi:response regulator [Halostreptopolyspora alba]|uniref:DNA-binding response regulator n=1 Tax=Halostreptopolyspora alba TaxID=2487137 RepID=A0A3N0E2Z0_9ACTN|nr:DNA-binding response regulator [Nocardiopsaceae bacterium YIM 96095]